MPIDPKLLEGWGPKAQEALKKLWDVAYEMGRQKAIRRLAIQSENAVKPCAGYTPLRRTHLRLIK